MSKIKKDDYALSGLSYIKIPNLLYFFIFVFLLILSGYLLWITHKKKYSLFDKISIWKYFFYFILIAILLLLPIFDVFEIFIIIGQSYADGLLWMLLNSLVLGMMFLCIGIIDSKTSKYTNYIILFIIFCLAISGCGYLGLRLDVNIPLFLWKSFQSNTIYGIWFYSLNSYLWIGLVFISTIFEKEKE